MEGTRMDTQVQMVRHQRRTGNPRQLIRLESPHYTGWAVLWTLATDQGPGWALPVLPPAGEEGAATNPLNRTVTFVRHERTEGAPGELIFVQHEGYTGWAVLWSCASEGRRDGFALPLRVPDGFAVVRVGQG